MSYPGIFIDEFSSPAGLRTGLCGVGGFVFIVILPPQVTQKWRARKK